MKKTALLNVLLVVASVLATLLVLEVVIEKTLLTRIPVKFHFALPSGLAVLAQSSKAERLPVNYVALAGDSYAHGKGDWLLQINPRSNDPFHSAHVLQQLTGYDVITFGRSGASSAKGWVREPVSKYRYIHDVIDSDLQPPRFILAFFYAGNDLSDNFLQVRDRFIPAYGEAAVHDDAAWDKFFSKEIRANNVGPHGSAQINRGWLMTAVFRIIKRELTGKDVETEVELAEEMAAQGKDTNQVVIDGVSTMIPGGLQAPGMGLDRQQTEIAFLAMAKSLARLKQAFPASQVVVVYVPSVMEVYALGAEQVSVFSSLPREGQYVQERFAAADLVARSAEVAARVAAEARAQGLPFIDTRQDLRAAGARHILHGPKDWLHLNRLNYEMFARSIACGMVAKQLWPEQACQSGVAASQ